jgi:hypothetical protein
MVSLMVFTGVEEVVSRGDRSRQATLTVPVMNGWNEQM